MRNPDKSRKGRLAGLQLILLALTPGVFAAATTDATGESPAKKVNPPHPSISGIGDHGRKSPLDLWSGSNNSYIRMNLEVQATFADQDNAWFGESRSNLGAKTSSWWDFALSSGLKGSYFSDYGDEIYGELSVVATHTQDIDGAGSNVDYGDTGDVLPENAYIGWRSGTRWSDLGKDFLDVSVGRQRYTAGNGFLFMSESSNGGKRGARWIGARAAADLSALIQINYEDLAVDLIYFKADDEYSSSDPDNNTEVTGITLDYALGDFGGIGGGYYGISAEAKPRDGMDVIDARFSITPFKHFMPDSVLEPLTFEGEFVGQDNGDALEANGWYLSAAYGWRDVVWTPSLTYRYAAFEGGEDSDGKSRNYDPLFYSFYGWGYWYQGEVLGEYVLGNSNLNSDMIKVGFDPTDTLHVNFFYYDFELDNAQAFGVQSSDFADEWDVTIDWTATDYLMLSLIGGYVKPDDGAKQYTGGDEDWSYFMVHANFTLK